MTKNSLKSIHKYFKSTFKFWGNQDFWNFPQKKFYNIGHRFKRGQHAKILVRRIPQMALDLKFHWKG